MRFLRSVLLTLLVIAAFSLAQTAKGLAASYAPHAGTVAAVSFQDDDQDTDDDQTTDDEQDTDDTQDDGADDDQDDTGGGTDDDQDDDADDEQGEMAEMPATGAGAAAALPLGNIAAGFGLLLAGGISVLRRLG